MSVNFPRKILVTKHYSVFCTKGTKIPLWAHSENFEKIKIPWKFFFSVHKFFFFYFETIWMHSVATTLDMENIGNIIYTCPNFFFIEKFNRISYVQYFFIYYFKWWTLPWFEFSAEISRVLISFLDSEMEKFWENSSKFSLEVSGFFCCLSLATKSCWENFRFISNLKKKKKNLEFCQSNSFTQLQ